MDRNVARSEADEPVLALRLVGGFELSHDDRAVVVAPACQRLLAFLALHDRPVRRGTISASLWPDSTAEHSAACLRTALWRLPSSELVAATATHLSLRDVSVDLRTCETLAWRLLGHGTPLDDRSMPVLPWIVRLSEDLLPSWYDDWVAQAREQFLLLRLHALEAWSIALRTQHRFVEALLAALAVVDIDPLRESAHRRVIEVYLDEGNVSEALKQYRQYERLLRTELGIGPSPALRAVVAPLLRDHRAGGA